MNDDEDMTYLVDILSVHNQYPNISMSKWTT